MVTEFWNCVRKRFGVIKRKKGIYSFAIHTYFELLLRKLDVGGGGQQRGGIIGILPYLLPVDAQTNSMKKGGTLALQDSLLPSLSESQVYQER